MMASEGNDGLGFLKGLVIGGIVGAVAGLLFAPRAGKELREDLKRKGMETLDEAEEFYGDARNKAQAILDDARQRAEDLKKEASRHLTEAREKARAILREAEAKKAEEPKPE